MSIRNLSDTRVEDALEIFSPSSIVKLDFVQTHGNWKIEAGNNGNNTLIIGSVSNATNNITLDATSGGSATFSGNVNLADDKKLNFGALPDYEIYHNSTTNVNHITSLSDRQLSINANNIFLTNEANNSTFLFANSTNASFSVNLMPSAENLYNIGSSSLRWEDLYVDDGFIRNAYIDTKIIHNGDDDNFIEFGTDTITISKAATFAGDVTAGGKLEVTHDTNFVGKFTNTATSMSNNNYTLMVDSSSHTSNMSTAGAMSVDVNSGRAFTITGQGKIGIGTDSPSYPLEVAGTNTVSIAYQRTGVSAKKWGFHSDNSNTYWQNLTDNVLALTISNAGNVGIGTTNPLHDLQIGTAATNGSYSMMIEGNFNDDALASNPRLNLIDTNFGITAGKYGSGTNNDALGFFAFQGAGRGIIFAHTTAGSGTHLKDMRQDMFIDGGTGNVGIGTTSPASLLEIYGGGNTLRMDSAGNTAKTFLMRNVNTATAEIKTDGNLDINIEDAGRTMRFLNGNTERMRIESSGYVIHKGPTGSGTNLQESWYYGTDSNFRLDLKQIVSSGLVKHSFNIVNNGASYDNNLVLDRGNVGIGTTSPAYKLEVNGQISISNASAPQLLFFEPGRAYTDGMRLLRYQDKLSLTYGWNANEEALTVVGGTGSDVGNVGIGTTSPSYKLEVNGTANIVSHLTAHCLGVGTAAPAANGVIRAAGDVIAYYSSDQRLKDNITKIEKPLEKLENINGYEFDWNDKQELYEGHDVGVVAQEIEEVYPQLVEVREDGYKAVKYEKLVPLLIESIKELKKEIDNIKNKSWQSDY